MDTSEKICVVGLGYVGLPLTLAFARRFGDVVGFDINSGKVFKILNGKDPTREGLEADLARTSARFSANPEILGDRTFFVVGVPTPVDPRKRPDLSPLRSACELIGPFLKAGAVVVFESTVYPGVTEDICGTLLAELSGLEVGKDFFIGYSPERINPGDKERSLEKIVKVVAGDSSATLERVATVYSEIIEAGVYRAPSIKVAEAAKVIENTQRDLNVALMNELALIFDRIGIKTKDVLDAAKTKWNFLPFTPGLVGGHCIGVDPYYLTTMAQEHGYHPQVILAGWKINDEMGIFLAQRLVKLLTSEGIPPFGARVGVLGVTFKENISDTRNSRVPELILELLDYGVTVLAYDPLADEEEFGREYELSLSPRDALTDLDALVYAVPHERIAEELPSFLGAVRSGGVVMDVKSRIAQERVPSSVIYWSL